MSAIDEYRKMLAADPTWKALREALNLDEYMTGVRMPHLNDGGPLVRHTSDHVGQWFDKLFWGQCYISEHNELVGTNPNPPEMHSRMIRGLHPRLALFDEAVQVEKDPVDLHSPFSPDVQRMLAYELEKIERSKS